MKVYDINNETEALSAINAILSSGNKAEVFRGKTGIVVLEIKRKLKYEHGGGETPCKDER